MDRHGVILYINRLEEGYELEQVLGTPVHELLDPGSGPAFLSALEAAWKKGVTPEQNLGVTTSTGAEEWYRSRIFALRKGGRTVAVLLVATNVSDLAAAQEELYRIRRLLPICAWCNRIRSDEGEWEPMETYVQRASGTGVTHGICPHCAQRHEHGMPSNGKTG